MPVIDRVSVRTGVAAAALAAVSCTAPAPAAVSTPTPSSSGVGTAAVAAPPLRVEPIPQRNFDPVLRSRVTALVHRTEELAGHQMAVTILNEHGRTVYDHRGDQLLLPASTLKVVTAAAALATLGPQYQYVTPVRATAPVRPDGALDGDLVVVGSGDPALTTPLYGAQVYPTRPRTPLEALADRVVAAGIRHVTGDVVADPRVFADQPLAEGWPARYLDDHDARPVSGLTVDGGLKVEDRGRVLIEPTSDPAAEAARALADLLTERGVTISGATRSSFSPPPAPIDVGHVSSPPLLELLRHTLRDSDNHFADAIFRTIGARTTGDGTWAGAEAAVRGALENLGLDWTGVRLADGSGLSRTNRVSAGFLARLDLALHGSPVGPAWRDLLAVAGVTGTLKQRLGGTIATGRLRGKTGTLEDVRGLVGRIRGSDDRAYHFAVLANDLAGAGRWRVLELQDELAVSIVAHLDGCERITLPPAPRPVSVPPLVDPYELRCTV
ncbi:MAG: D-alanyl-D-alanine carboxypeptidase/D-alanyl-D-alanine-endopeptidase [Actinobacteria bacterium]|nr:D-alanyl-D-alanine carboxypeptidase/D-alanyl-D-alanine-endopeptidase [Actinomycetota bacterium]